MERSIVILKPLSSSPGSMAFLAVEKEGASLRWPLVVVWVPEEVERDPERMRALLEETDRAVQLDHPNVNRVLGVEQLPEGWARLVEFSDGETLRRVLQAVQRAGRPALSPKVAARIVADAARGVDYVHGLGHSEGSVRFRLHGAIKPETVIAGFDGVAKITGYGANAVAPRDAFGPTATVRSQYLSPEEIERGPAFTDRRSDVYSLGLVLYEAIAGRPPWKADDPAFEYQVLNDPLPLEPLGPASAALKEVVAKALARVPADRFQTAAQLADALEAASPAPSSAVAADLARLFTPDGPERAERRNLLTAAGFTGERWPRPEPRKPEDLPALPVPAPVSEGPTTSVPPHPSPPPPPAGEGAAPASPTANASPTPSPPPAKVPPPQRTTTAKVARKSSPDLRVEKTPPPRRGIHPAVIVLASLGSAAAAGIVVYLAMYRVPATAPPPPPPVVAATAPKPPEPPPAPSTAPLPPPVPLEPPAPPPLDPGTLDLASNPSMAVTVDGKPHGSTPVTVKLPPGSHVIHFRGNGVDEERTVRVKPGGHGEVSVSVARAGMDVTAPAGSRIFLDGRFVATAPTSTLHFYAGRHHIKVVMGKAIFERPFEADEGETLTLDVHPEQVP